MDSDMVNDTDLLGEAFDKMLSNSEENHYSDELIEYDEKFIKDSISREGEGYLIKLGNGSFIGMNEKTYQDWTNGEPIKATFSFPGSGTGNGASSSEPYGAATIMIDSVRDGSILDGFHVVCARNDYKGVKTNPLKNIDFTMNAIGINGSEVKTADMNAFSDGTKDFDISYSYLTEKYGLTVETANFIDEQHIIEEPFLGVMQNHPETNFNVFQSGKNKSPLNAYNQLTENGIDVELYNYSSSKSHVMLNMAVSSIMYKGYVDDKYNPYIKMEGNGFYNSDTNSYDYGGYLSLVQNDTKMIEWCSNNIYRVLNKGDYNNHLKGNYYSNIPLLRGMEQVSECMSATSNSLDNYTVDFLNAIYDISMNYEKLDATLVGNIKNIEDGNRANILQLELEANNFFKHLYDEQLSIDSSGAAFIDNPAVNGMIDMTDLYYMKDIMLSNMDNEILMTSSVINQIVNSKNLLDANFLQDEVWQIVSEDMADLETVYQRRLNTMSEIKDIYNKAFDEIISFMDEPPKMENLDMSKLDEYNEDIKKNIKEIDSLKAEINEMVFYTDEETGEVKSRHRYSAGEIRFKENQIAKLQKDNEELQKKVDKINVLSEMISNITTQVNNEVIGLYNDYNREVKDLYFSHSYENTL